jgi:putative effector of murein hydrolase
MYDTTKLWLEDPKDFKVVLTTCGVSGCFSILLTSLAAVNPMSPLSIPHPLSLPMLHRSVMSALGIEGSMAIGPECDPKLAVASILITGCIGASLGNTLLELCPGVFNSTSSLVRGVAMGCSAHSIGTAGLISSGDTDAAAISGASMCLAGTMHTLVLALPGVVPQIRALAKLPPLA